MIAAASLAATTFGAEADEAASCEAFRITRDGRETRMSASDASRLRADPAISARASSTRLSSRASARGSVSSSSSAFVSSSSRGGGTARAVTEVDGQRVTIIHDRLGCRIIVDER